jgi:hypothetical protein
MLARVLEGLALWLRLRLWAIARACLTLTLDGRSPLPLPLSPHLQNPLSVIRTRHEQLAVDPHHD